MRVENFRNYWLYKQSLALMNAIYRLVDDDTFNPNNRQTKELYRCATKIPKLIASGVGQTNMNIRIKRFNEAKDILDVLWQTIRTYEKQYQIDRRYLDEIEENRIQVVKILNRYFGSLTKV